MHCERTEEERVMKRFLILGLVFGLASTASAVPVLTAEKTIITVGETIEVYITGAAADATTLPGGPAGGYRGVLWTDYSDYVTTAYEDDPYLFLDVTSGVIANAAGGAANIGKDYSLPNFAVTFLASPTTHTSGDIFQEADDVDAGLWFTFEVTGTAEGTTTLELWDWLIIVFQDSVDIKVVPAPVAPLEGLEIIGPNEVAENFRAQYKAIGHYDNNSTVDVTDLAVWSVEPNDIASIEAGLLTTEPMDLPQDVIITAQYTEGDIVLTAEKQVSILTICPSGTALEFDGGNDYVSIPDDSSLEGMSELTITMWLKPDTLANYDTPIHKGNWSGSQGHGFVCNLEYNGTIVWGTYVGIGKRIFGGHLSTGEWTFIGLWFRGDDEWRIYQDGSLDANTTATVSSIPTTGGNVGIGQGFSGGGTYFDGKIEEVAIYDRALSAEEIRANMHRRLTGSEPNLVMYLDLDEGQGQVAYDATLYGNDGRLGSTPDADDSDPEWVGSDAPVGICTPVEVDIKPGSCPNPLNLASRGILPAAILGSEDFDVNTIDPASIFLEGVPAIRSSYEDIAAPVVDGNECECTTVGPDSYLDLTLKFKTQDVVEALIFSEGELAQGQTLELTLNGELYDGMGIQGTDCVILVGNVSKWLAAQRWDANADGVINLLDLAELANYWLECNLDPPGACWE